MGPISLAADGRGLSIRDRIVLAAAETVKAAGIDVQDTNISVGSAYYHAKKSRVEVSERVQEEFQCPDHRLQTSGGDWVHPHPSSPTDAVLLSEAATKKIWRQSSHFRRSWTEEEKLRLRLLSKF